MAGDVRHYLLRVWWEEEDDRGWRASLRNVQNGKLITFSEPDALMRYLNEKAPRFARSVRD